MNICGPALRSLCGVNRSMDALRAPGLLCFPHFVLIASERRSRADFHSDTARMSVARDANITGYGDPNTATRSVWAQLDELRAADAAYAKLLADPRNKMLERERTRKRYLASCCLAVERANPTAHGDCRVTRRLRDEPPQSVQMPVVAEGGAGGAAATARDAERREGRTTTEAAQRLRDSGCGASTQNDASAFAPTIHFHLRSERRDVLGRTRAAASHTGVTE